MRYPLAFALVGVALVVVAGVWTWQHHEQGKANQAQAIDTQNHQEAIRHADQAASLDAQAQEASKTVDASADLVAKLRGEVARLRKAAAAPVVQPAAPAVADLAPLVAKQDELIQALTVENAGLKKALNLEHAAYLQSYAAYQDECKARNASEMALKAQIAANKASRWQGRIEGFAIGIGGGYVAGRLK